jgi:8-oxo-dGTP diphosphatase
MGAVSALRVIAAAIVDARGLLLVSKRAAPDVYYLPGGKPFDGEPPLDCLQRELAEELGVGLESADAFMDVHAPAALERGVEMWMSVFLARLAGRPAPAAEIASLRFWPSDGGLRLAAAVRDHVIPELQLSGRLAQPGA